LIADFGAKPAFKGYYDYPCVLCTSVNEEIVHGIPSEKRVLKAGEIVSSIAEWCWTVFTETLPSRCRLEMRSQRN